MQDVRAFGKGVLRSEGVVVDKNNFVYGGGRNGIIYQVTPDEKVVEFCTLPSGSIPNGITMDQQGNIFYCDLGKQAIIKVDRLGRPEMFADRAGDTALTLPNFATFDADGNLYVSISSDLTIDNVFEEIKNPKPTGSLVRFRTDGRSEIVATGLWFANGTAIDPQESAVYVLQSTRSDCLRIEIKSDGSFGHPEVYSSDFPSHPDGMAFAADGSLYVTLTGYGDNGHFEESNQQLIVIDTDGRWSPFVDRPDGSDGSTLRVPTNCAFGGPDLRDLFIANVDGDHLSHVRTSATGHPLYHQR
ncbi:SMP-30/gluconolactonase/LRE family protein [Sphingomonas paeninsulae]|uniref:SMP-30/gluconolactonase/LRE family protein n=1 Tax=Sphingomonas paeninsulae TaxID=2319844 RepID=UPI0013CE9991|nr:SMP-30/gluconolactonase/LRE family protein [Sphingomonas paeninsulae]